MAEFKVRTKGGATAQGRPRVYFTCHPTDFDKYFDKICEDVFKTHDCAIYYTADMTEPLDDTNISVDLGRMNLYLVPVTFRLMSEENRAMQVDIAYAKEHNIPIIPFMMESGIDEIYYLPSNFGERQYISPFISDPTAISYDDKLKKHLEAVLIGDEMTNRVRSAFDAYIFLSYRKKDRYYANELMKIIHNIPPCRDIAIWYDEFLTPGESFTENIKKAMDKSEMFALLVTPNILEDNNFVMREEYPIAKKEGMKILPTEMENTDREELSAKFDGIPTPVKTDDEHFSEALISVVKRISISENDSDPEHIFLIGLAYLDGIDVEVNVERGIELITKAAEAELPEAMERLYCMYRDGDGVALDYQEALKWIERLISCKKIDFKADKEYALKIKGELASIYDKVGYYEEAGMAWEELYNLCVDYYGDNDINTINALGNLAYSQVKIANTAKDFAKALGSISSILGRDGLRAMPFLCLSLSNLLDEICKRVSPDEEDEYKELLKLGCSLQKKCYNSLLSNFGIDSQHTLAVASNYGNILSILGEKSASLKLQESIYDICKSSLGDNHPDTLRVLSRVADLYFDMHNYRGAYNLYKDIYSFYIDIYGRCHPYTIDLFGEIISSLMRIGNYLEAIKLNTQAYDLYRAVLSEDATGAFYADKKVRLYNEILDQRKKLIISCASLHSSFIRNYERLGANHELIINAKRAMPILIEMLEGSYSEVGLCFDEIVSERIEDTPFVIAIMYIDLDEWDKARKYLEMIYEIYNAHISKQNYDKYIDNFILIMKKLALVYTEMGKYREGFILNERILDIYTKSLGENHLDTIDAMEELAKAYCNLNEWEKASLLYKQIYVIRRKVMGRKHKDTISAKQNYLFIVKMIRKKKV